MIFSQIAEALRDDEALNKWCSANLGGLPHIMIGIDEMNPPDRDKYALIALTDIETSGEGMGSGKVTYTIPISCGVMCDEIGISDRIEIYKGLPLVEEFRVQVAEALLRNAPKYRSRVKVDANAMSITAHPLYVSIMAADFETLKPLQIRK